MEEAVRFDRFSEDFDVAVNQALQALLTRRDSELPVIIGAHPLGTDPIVAGLIADAAHRKHQAWQTRPKTG